LFKVIGLNFRKRTNIEGISRTTPRSKSLKKQIVEHVAQFSLGSFVANVGQVVNGYFGALLLGPTVWGVWQSAKVIRMYASYTGLGVANGMYREVPLSKGKADINDVILSRDVAFTFCLFVGVLTAIAIFGTSFIIQVREEFLISLRFISGMVMMQFIGGMYNLWFKANNRFEVVSLVSVIQGIGNIVAISLIFLFSLNGFLTGQFLCLVIINIIYYLNCNGQMKIKWHFPTLKKLVLIGLPIMLIALSGFLFITTDRLIILATLGFKNLGFYSLAGFVFTPCMMIISSANSVMFPRFCERYGQTGSKRSLLPYITKPIGVLSLSIPILVGIIFLVTPLFVKYLLPEYQTGIIPAQILIFGLVFYAMVGMIGNFLITIDRQALYFIIMLSCVSLNFLLSYGLIKAGFGIAGVAIGTSVSYFVYFAIMLIVAKYYCEVGWTGFLWFFSKIVAPTIYVLAVVVCIKSMSQYIFSPSINPLVNLLLQLLIFSIFLFPLLIKTKKMLTLSD